MKMLAVFIAFNVGWTMLHNRNPDWRRWSIYYGRGIDAGMRGDW